MTGAWGWAWWLGAALLLAAMLVGLSAWGSHRWAQAARALGRGLDASQRGGAPRVAPRPTRHDVRELEGLPAPVQRYFRAVLTDGQPIVTAVDIDMVGTFNLSPTGARWRPFTSRQRAVTHRPGFVWDAQVALLPGLAVRVVDSYIAGQGLLRAAVQGLVSVADIRGAGDVARGEFMRWFAEAAWYPTALLPSQGVQWSAVDAHSANATVVDGALRLTLLFRFNDEGLIDGFRAAARGSRVGGALVLAPWEGQWSDYRVQDGMRLPFAGTVAWVRPDGRKPYFVGTVQALRIAFAP